MQGIRIAMSGMGRRRLPDTARFLGPEARVTCQRGLLGEQP
jgi:hypothetical protein